LTGTAWLPGWARLLLAVLPDARPAFKQLSEQYSDIAFVSVDVDKVAPVAREYNIRAMPTVIFFKNGDKADDLMGANTVSLKDKVTAMTAQRLVHSRRPSGQPLPDSEALAVLRCATRGPGCGHA
jgi:thioredoxin-like negative regulator of GroEL